MKKLFTSIFLMFIFICASSFSLAANDYFSSLQNLSLGQTISDSIFNNGKNHGLSDYNGNKVSVLTYESSASSNPHIIYVKEDRSIAFIQLTIPQNQETVYHQQLTALGNKGLDTLYKTKTEIMLSYPQSGIAYILNGYSNTIMRIQKFTPKSAEKFRIEEGANFHPVPEPTGIFDISKTSQQISTTSSKTNNKLLSLLSNKTFLIITIIFIILILIGIILVIRKRLSQKSSF